ncbi:MAG: alcohol dehydrogenase catalytic domain-containing protein [Actinobacteria bacterium]|nr:alcohol dehydrogenase catalytic domain-containing protein [Actinomycetota bacterium]
MRGLVFKESGKVAVEDVSEPTIEDEKDAIVRVTTAPICGSDLHLYHGRVPGLTEGTVIGHELVGIVEEVGTAVTKIKPGDRVIGSFLVPCGECWWCTRQEYQNCDNGNFRALGYGIFSGDLQGAQAEKVRMPNADLTLLAIEDDLSDEQAVFAGDILTTGYYAAELANISKGDTVAVIGCGPVGLFTLQYAKLHEPGQLIALDSVEERLLLAEKIGATPVDIGKRNPVTMLAEMTDGRGADIAIDCVGHEKAFRNAYEMLRSGGHLVVVGVYVELEYPFPLGEAWRKNIQISFSGVTPVPRYWEKALDEVRAGRVDPTIIISHTLSLEEGPKGYELFDTKQATKVMLKP